MNTNFKFIDLTRLGIKLESTTKVKTALTPVKIVKEVKYPGLIVDNKLTFGPHITHLEFKLSRAVGILSKFNHFLPSPLLLKLYFALFHSNLLYWLLIRHNTYKTYASKITELQKKQ